MTKKKQYYLNISTAGMVADVSTREIGDSEMRLKDVVKEVLAANGGYGFRYTTKEYVEKDGKKFFADKVRMPFNFIDPLCIQPCTTNKGHHKITIRNDWAEYYFVKNDNIIFTSDEAEKAFVDGAGDCPLKIIRYWSGD